MYQKMYTTLFNAITDALDLMECKDYAAARLRLLFAQRDAEEIYISEDGQPPLEICPPDHQPKDSFSPLDKPFPR